MRKFKIRFYKTDSNNSIIWKFLKKLTGKEFAKIRFISDLLRKEGVMLGMPYAEPISDGVYALRTYINKHWIRVFYFFYIDDIIIYIDGIIKKSSE